ncbi:iron(III) transport system ATP-binding protein [Glaciihabitans tibetensis]|uniref:Iron(III) transport system ATP-binding protein n=1 Tax=Glaciihabitans tibetensis TaxID=1266600 RepID=A0A2T0VC11_9MICO|nr:ABC transporter ATP-binding protein [Glaciihabitans tibetensis]PRY67692.1 iron(III) transport system ATP-binding protein [Glaciihabitans tibetensis]
MASVSLDSVTLRYPSGTVGLADIDLHIADGEFVALLGPSGSGKTTLLRTVAGFLTPTAGTIRIGDRTVAEAGKSVPPELRGLGMVFQQHAVWPHWNVGRNVDYPLRRSGVARRERTERVEKALTLVGLEDFARRDPATLSGGQRQRVALARALVAEPRVLLLDEALSALDEPLRDRLRIELQALTRRMGLTVLHVTHDRDEALALADRVVVLDSGRIQQIATPSEMLARPASALVARFLSDATTITGMSSADGFAAAGHPLIVQPSRLEGVRSTGSCEIAILPEDVEIAPASGSGGRDAGTRFVANEATVVSSLFGRDGNDVVLDWDGLSLRCRSRSHRPVVGERVTVSVARAIVYALAPAVATEPTLEPAQL